MVAAQDLVAETGLAVSAESSEEAGQPIQFGREELQQRL